MLHGTARGSVVLLESTVINYIEIDSFIYVAIECCALCSTLSEVSVHTQLRARFMHTRGVSLSLSGRTPEGEKAPDRGDGVLASWRGSTHVPLLFLSFELSYLCQSLFAPFCVFII